MRPTPHPQYPAPLANAPPPSPLATIFSAQWQASGQVFAAHADQPLLLSAQQAGIVLTSSCRNGTCRACMGQLVSGQVSYRIAWPGLSLDKKQCGVILPCVAHPASDVVMAPYSET